MSDSKEFSDVQVLPGWGTICTECLHVYADERKYTAFPPSTPCRHLLYDSGFHDKNGKYHPPVLMLQLERYKDGSEFCPSFVKAKEDKPQPKTDIPQEQGKIYGCLAKLFKPLQPTKADS